MGKQGGILPLFTLRALVVRYPFCIFFVTRFSGRDITGKIIQFLAFSVEMDRKLSPSLWSLCQAGKQENQCFPPGLAKYDPGVDSNHCLVLKIKLYWNTSTSIHSGTARGHSPPARAESRVAATAPEVSQSGPS